MQVYSWGDNDHGQLGNTSTICNRKPQLVGGVLKGQKITHICCGSSHSLAYAQGSPATTGEFSPVSFLTPQDPMGASLVMGKTQEEGRDQSEKKRPSLTRIILSLTSPSRQQEALGHVLTALQIAYARDTIVNALGGVVMTSVKEKDADAEVQTPVELSSAIPLLSSIIGSPEEDYISQSHSISSNLDEFTKLLTVEDARVMVDLLKLAVSGRVGERGKETLSAILMAMGKANPEVSVSVHYCCT